MQHLLLETKRLSLRAITQEVYDHIFALTDKEICAFFGFTKQSEFDSERKRHANGLSTFNKTFLYFQLIEKETNEIIGWCGFHTWYLDHNRAELGYGLNSDTFKRKGYMSEAITPILEYGAANMNLHRIEAMASAENTASIKLLESNGFKKEGVLKEHYLINGVYEDSTVYGLIRGK